MTNNPYLVPALRDETGVLNAAVIASVFGFDRVDFTQVSEGKSSGPRDFADVVAAQGRDVLTRLATAVMLTVGAKGKPTEQVFQEMRAFMGESADGLSRRDFVRQGGALLLLEERYGGIRDDPFAAEGNGYGEMAGWFGFEESELPAIATVTGLALFEAIASALHEWGYEIGEIKERYDLARIARHTKTSMFEGRGLRELFTINAMLFHKGLREQDVSNLGGGGYTVYRRPGEE